MRLLDVEVVAEELGLPPEVAAQGEWPLAWPDPLLAGALAWAQREYPGAEPRQAAAFAALVQYFATGWYGGYGTENDPAERRAERLLLAFAGGWAPAGGVVAWGPPLDEAGRPQLPLPPAAWTRAALRLLATALLGRGLRAAADEAALLLQREAGPVERLGPAREALLRLVEEDEG
jgi:hypothetical protein